ncbi:MAG TPA: hypothetical protein VFZ24_05485 [Longimicrobiales bacterium]
MKKLIGAVLVLAIIWAIPDLRNRIGMAAVPLLDRLGPVGEAIANPFREVRARNEIKFFLRILNDDRTEGRQVPDEGTFIQWVDRRMPQETGIDPWGSQYWLQRRGNTFTVGSSGVDRERDTDDDVVETLAF